MTSDTKDNSTNENFVLSETQPQNRKTLLVETLPLTPFHGERREIGATLIFGMFLLVLMSFYASLFI